MTPAQQKAALDAARLGHTMPACAARAGVTRQTLHHWRKDYADFSVKFDLALQEGRAKLEGHALDGAIEDPKHALELLSRRYPKAWGKSDRMSLKVEAKVGDGRQLSPEQSIEAIDRMRAEFVRQLEGEKE